MRKSSAIRAAMRLRKWCRNQPKSCEGCVFRQGNVVKHCVLAAKHPVNWPAMSFDDKEDGEDATD